MSALDSDTRRVLEGFEDLVYAARLRVEQLSDDDLNTFLVSAARVTPTNCNWALYAVASKSLWLYEAAAAELVKRNKSRDGAAGLRAVVH